MNRRRLLVSISSLVAAAAVSLALVVPLTPAVHAAPMPPGTHPFGGSGGTSPWCTEWHIMPSPQPSGMNSTLAGVAAAAANDLWAVGDAYTSSVTQTFVEHYDGTAWSIVSSPNVPGSIYDALFSATALAANNVWAAGYAVLSTGEAVTLIEHYDGSSWKIVSSPNASPLQNILGSVAADASNDIWVVGDYVQSGGGTEPLTEHYNGSSWSIVSAPTETSVTVLFGVSVISGQAFAAGYYFDTSDTPHTLVEHYTAGAWTIMTTRDVGTTGSFLAALGAISPTNVWAAGWTQGGGNTTGGLIEHYGGTAWSVVANGSSLPTTLTGLAVVPGTTNLWAVGSYATSSTTSNTFAEQWQGHVWNAATSASPGGMVATLRTVAAVSATDAWAVGNSYNSTSGQSLIEHYAGPPAQVFCR